MSSLRECVTLIKVRLDILERAIDRGHSQETANQLKALRRHALQLVLASEARGTTERLISALNEASDGYSHQPEASSSAITIEGTYDLAKLAKELAW